MVTHDSSTGRAASRPGRPPESHAPARDPPRGAPPLDAARRRGCFPRHRPGLAGRRADHPESVPLGRPCAAPRPVRRMTTNGCRPTSDSGIRTRPTSWKRAPTCGRCNSCSGTRRPRTHDQSISTSLGGICRPRRIRWSNSQVPVLRESSTRSRLKRRPSPAVSRPPVEVADILHAHGDIVLEMHPRAERPASGGPPGDRALPHRRTGWASRSPPTPARTRPSYNRCRDRHCPKCQAQARAALARRAPAGRARRAVCARRLHAPACAATARRIGMRRGSTRGCFS